MCVRGRGRVDVGVCVCERFSGRRVSVRSFVLGRIRRTEICINLIRIYDVCNVRITCMYASHVCSIHPYIHIYIRIEYVCVCVCVCVCVQSAVEGQRCYQVCGVCHCC